MSDPVENLDWEFASRARELALQLRNAVTLLEMQLPTHPEDRRLLLEAISGRLIPREYTTAIESIQQDLRSAGYNAERVAEFSVPESIASAQQVILQLEAVVMSIMTVRTVQGSGRRERG